MGTGHKVVDYAVWGEAIADEWMVAEFQVWDDFSDAASTSSRRSSAGKDDAHGSAEYKMSTKAAATVEPECARVSPGALRLTPRTFATIEWE